MKYLLYLILVFILVSCSNSEKKETQYEVSLLQNADTNLYTGKIVEYYIDGKQKKYEEVYNQGIKEGKYNYWFRNGMLKLSGEYSKNKRVGVWKWYTEKGELDYTVNYNQS